MAVLVPSGVASPLREFVGFTEDHDSRVTRRPEPPKLPQRTPTLTSATPTTTQAIHIYLCHGWFCVSWWLVLSFHILLGSYALSVTALHRYLQDPMVSHSIAALQMPRQTLQMTARAFFLVGFAHFVATVRMLHSTIKAKRLAFYSFTPATTEIAQRPGTSALRQQLVFLADCAKTAWSKLFSGTGYFGLSGPYFEVLFIARESLEIVLQTYQAYKLSRSVPRAWINQLAVAAIFLNCIASPLVHWVYRHNEAKRRLVNLLQDAVLDFCCSVVIPLGIVLPYVSAFNTVTYGFPIELLADDVWFMNAVSEGRQVLITSPLDFVATLLPHISLLSCLVTAKNVLRRKLARVQAAETTAATRKTTQQPHHVKVSAIPESPRRSVLWSGLLKAAKLPSSSSRRIHVSQRLNHASRAPDAVRRWRRIFIHVVFVIWGAVVLSLHLQAIYTNGQQVPGCQLYVDAWSSSGFPCSVMLLNCHTQGIQGSAEETHRVLSKLERSSLRVLVFSHCPALHVPAVTSEFAALGGIELFNCSLVDWPMAAALTQDTHPRMGYIFIVLTNWTTFPQGLLHDELPTSLTHFMLVASNITALPETIGDAWSTPKWIYLAFDALPNLHEVPVSMCKVQTVVLALTNTRNSSLPPDCVANVALQQLSVAGSPFVVIPSALNRDLAFFAAEYTKIEELPAWFVEWIDSGSDGTPGVTLYASPVCNSSQCTDHWDAMCATDWRTASDTYPWEIMLPMRPYDLGSPPQYTSN